MKKNTLLYVLLAFLVIANVFFLFQFLNIEKEEPSKRGQKPEQFMVKALDFDEAQMEAFEVISDLHFDRMQSLSQNIRKLKDQLFSRVGDNNIDAQEIDSITTLIGQYEKQKDDQLFYHLQKVRDLCNDRQKKKFEGIMKDALRRGPHGKGPKGDRPPRHKGDGPPPPRH